MVFLLASVVVMADKLKLQPDYEDLISEDIYKDGETWRAPAGDDSNWRDPYRESDRGRIKFGYDPAYEQVRSWKQDPSRNNPLESVGPKPNNQFRMSF